MEKIVLCKECGLENLQKFSKKEIETRGKYAYCQHCESNVWFAVNRDGKHNVINLPDPPSPHH